MRTSTKRKSNDSTIDQVPTTKRRKRTSKSLRPSPRRFSLQTLRFIDYNSSLRKIEIGTAYIFIPNTFLHVEVDSVFRLDRLLGRSRYKSIIACAKGHVVLFGCFQQSFRDARECCARLNDLLDEPHLQRLNVVTKTEGINYYQEEIEIIV